MVLDGKMLLTFQPEVILDGQSSRPAYTRPFLLTLAGPDPRLGPSMEDPVHTIAMKGLHAWTIVFKPTSSDPMDQGSSSL